MASSGYTRLFCLASGVVVLKGRRSHGDVVELKMASRVVMRLRIDCNIFFSCWAPDPGLIVVDSKMSRYVCFLLGCK